ncbi:MAG TPA: histidine phosphotransferase family protein [Caulobacteraceae bacterium]|nr:histidine phosphotransferase family protein [Caulobacteraceae bacterium]
MSQPHPAFPPADQPVSPEELAAKLASKLCHDFISPAGAIVSGLDLLDDPTAKDMRDEAMDLIASSARKLVDQLAFARVAFGSSAGVAGFDCNELERLTRGVYGHVRATLEWTSATPSLPKAAAQSLVNLAQLAAGALPLGGVARVETSQDSSGYVISIVATGPKARLHAEVAEGLSGAPLGDGLGGRWVQAYYVHAIATAAGGTVQAEVVDDTIRFRAVLPA